STGAKEMHNGSLDCTECHLYVKQDIHGVKYLQQDNTYSTSNASAVNCSTCHQTGGLSNITATIPAVPDPLYHSEDSDSGAKWNLTASPYWSSTGEACEYCHNDTKHSTGALGNLAPISGEATDFTGDICAACHQSGSTYYNSVTSNLSQTPPEINTTQSSTDGTVFYNHSTMSGYTDDKCLGCHQNASNNPLNTTWFAHDVYTASAIECVSCHDAPIDFVPTAVQVNISATNNSSESIHYNLNGASTDDNKRCYACHGNGSTPTTHPSVSGAKLCEDCHVGTSNFSAPVTGRHIPDAAVSEFRSTSNMTTNYAQCVECHNNSVNASGTMWLSNESRISHYGTNSSLVETNSNASVDQCYNCHDNVINAANYGNASQTVMATQVECYKCHNGDWNIVRRGRSVLWVFSPVEPGVLHNVDMGTYWACSTCH
ncbi:MAG: hypothetical protein KAJ55_05320, partial [Anaerolineales bacterium]|nr:hypothetical protein [Anaerolineales bacterium]